MMIVGKITKENRMLFMEEYTYFIRKDCGFIVLGKIRGLKLLGPDFLFPQLIKNKRLNMHWIKKYLFEGKGEIVARNFEGRDIFLAQYNAMVKEKIQGQHFTLKLLGIKV